MQVYMHPKKSVYNVTDDLISIHVITSIDPNFEQIERGVVDLK